MNSLIDLLDEEPLDTTLFLALADMAEEQGRNKEAFLWREIYRVGIKPTKFGDNSDYRWQWGHGEDWVWTRGNSGNGTILPYALWERLHFAGQTGWERRDTKFKRSRCYRFLIEQMLLTGIYPC